MKQRSPWRDGLRAFARSRTAVVGLLLAASLVIAAALASVVSPFDPLEMNMKERLSRPSPTHLLGTDQYGRDVLSRILHGTGVSLIVSFFSIAIAATVGTVVGCLSAYRGGIPDLIVAKLVDALMSFPTLILGLLVVALLGGGVVKLTLTVSVTFLPRFVRLARGETLRIRELQYIEAARALGSSRLRVALRHVMPNLLGSTLVMVALWMAAAIRIEASLSFLGFGVNPPNPTWGNMLREAVRWLSSNPWTSIFAGGAIFTAVLAFNLVGDGLRDMLAPRLRGPD